MSVFWTELLDGRRSGDARMLLCRVVRLEEWSLARMATPHWRLYLPLMAGGRLAWRGRVWPLRPGSWLLVAPGTSCAAGLDRPIVKAYAHFLWSPSGVRPAEGVHTGSLRSGDARRVAGAVKRGDGLALGLFMQELFRHGVARLPADAFIVDEATASPAVARALELLRRDPSVTPSNAALAAAVGLHPGSLVRLFTREVGRPPQRQAMRFRLEHAAMLLAESGDDIEAVASACGFGDRHHFSRAFARHWGQGPATFRRQIHGR